MQLEPTRAQGEVLDGVGCGHWVLDLMENIQQRVADKETMRAILGAPWPPVWHYTTKNDTSLISNAAP